jgi:hypothetical protein
MLDYFLQMQDGVSKGEADWGGMLDRLSQVLTPQEDAGVRQVIADKRIPSGLLDLHLHKHVAELLVNHGISTWPQLHLSFPGEVPALHATEAGLITFLHHLFPNYGCQCL